MLSSNSIDSNLSKILLNTIGTLEIIKEFLFLSISKFSIEYFLNSFIDKKLKSKLINFISNEIGSFNECLQ